MKSMKCTTNQYKLSLPMSRDKETHLSFITALSSLSEALLPQHTAFSTWFCWIKITFCLLWNTNYINLQIIIVTQMWKWIITVPTNFICRSGWHAKKGGAGTEGGQDRTEGREGGNILLKWQANQNVRETKISSHPNLIQKIKEGFS